MNQDQHIAYALGRVEALLEAYASINKLDMPTFIRNVGHLMNLTNGSEPEHVSDGRKRRSDAGVPRGKRGPSFKKSDAQREANRIYQANRRAERAAAGLTSRGTSKRHNVRWARPKNPRTIANNSKGLNAHGRPLAVNSFWSKLTPEQRSAEMQRRKRVAAGLEPSRRRFPAIPRTKAAPQPGDPGYPKGGIA
jgi:hypothetical protein